MACEYCKDTKKIKEGGIERDCYCVNLAHNVSVADESKLFIIAKEIDSLVSRVAALEEQLATKKRATKKKKKDADSDVTQDAAIYNDTHAS